MVIECGRDQQETAAGSVGVWVVKHHRWIWESNGGVSVPSDIPRRILFSVER